MAKCPAITRSGESCKGVVAPGATYCVAHDPARKEERRRNAVRAGRSKPNRELQNIKTRLSGLADQVLDGEVDRANAAVAGQLYNTIIRAVGVELKIREQLDLIERLEELESLIERQSEGSRYGTAR